MSVQPGDDDSDAIYSVSEGFDDTEQIGGGLLETIYMLREVKDYWLGKEGGYRAQVRVTPEIYHCQHEWDQQHPLPEDRRPECTTCKRDLSSYSKEASATFNCYQLPTTKNEQRAIKNY